MSILRNCLILFFVCLLAGCGGDDDDSFVGFPIQVTKMDLGDETLRVGDGTVLFTEFSFDFDDIFFFGDHVALAVRLPNGVAYRSGTAEIDGAGGDIRVTPRVVSCGSGVQFLEFDLDADALDGASDPGGDSDAQLKLTVDAVSNVGNVSLEARAERDRVLFSCSEDFLADDSVFLTVVP